MLSNSFPAVFSITEMQIRYHRQSNKYLRENDLKPTPDHSLYSLRHTFKDRLRDAGAQEEVIDELMGHKKSGPKYGRGHILESKLKWLEKGCL